MVSSALAATRYAAAASVASSAVGGEDGGTAQTSASASFGRALESALAETMRSLKEADSKAMQAVAGAADITEVVSAVARAELALQTTIAIRDRVIQAYQDVMRMPI